jgi:hypothetical protein
MSKLLLKHGDCGTTEHMTWIAIHQRCENAKHKAYKNYGGRGIYVSDNWSTYENFLRDMGRKPTPSHTIERKNNDGPYSKENCVWATRSDQAKNKRNNRYVVFGGKDIPVREASIITGLKVETILNRIRLGWSDHEALTTSFSTA